MQRSCEFERLRPQNASVNFRVIAGGTPEYLWGSFLGPWLAQGVFGSVLGLLLGASVVHLGSSGSAFGALVGVTGTLTECRGGARESDDPTVFSNLENSLSSFGRPAESQQLCSEIAVFA